MSDPTTDGGSQWFSWEAGIWGGSGRPPVPVVVPWVPPIGGRGITIFTDGLLIDRKWRWIPISESPRNA